MKEMAVMTYEDLQVAAAARAVTILMAGIGIETGNETGLGPGIGTESGTVKDAGIEIETGRERE